MRFMRQAILVAAMIAIPGSIVSAGGSGSRHYCKVTCTEYAQYVYDTCCNKGENPLYCWWQFREAYKGCFNCCYNVD